MRKIIVITLALAVITAGFFAACEFGFDTRPGTGAGGFVPVQEITGIPAWSQPYIVTSLTGTVLPQDATNKLIEWSVKSDGGTQSVMNERGTGFTANAEGTVTVTALIKEGRGSGADYTQDFSIVISLSELYAVKDILGIPSVLPVGTHTLDGRVSPANAANQSIIWTITDQGGTGAVFSGANTLATERRGTLKIRATILNGGLDSDFIQDFSIVITQSVVASGYYFVFDGGYQDRACYWVDEERIFLEEPGTSFSDSYATGIVYLKGKQYISGHYTYGINNAAVCYWENGVLKTLPDNTGPYGGSPPDTTSLSIAAEGNYVYISGRVNGNFYYWKIDTTIEDENTRATRTYLTPPAGRSIAYISYNYFPYRAYITVKNGKVYIPFMTASRDGTGDSYYWDETGNPVKMFSDDYGSGSPTSSVYGLHVYAIAVLGDKLYAAGGIQYTQWGYDIPGYWDATNPSAPPIALESSVYFNSMGCATSIIEQNGSLRFYGWFESWNSGIEIQKFSYLSWDEAGNRTELFMPYYEYFLFTDSVFLLGGETYILIRDPPGFTAAYYGDPVGYVIPGGQGRVFSGPNESAGRVTGLALQE